MAFTSWREIEAQEGNSQGLLENLFKSILPVFTTSCEKSG